MAHVSSTPRRAPSVVDRVKVWLAGSLKALNEIRLEAELRRKLQGVDAHLLRDMGLTWTGSRYERDSRDDGDFR